MPANMRIKWSILLLTVLGTTIGIHAFHAKGRGTYLLHRPLFLRAERCPDDDEASRCRDHAPIKGELLVPFETSVSPLQLFMHTVIDSKRHLIAAAVARGTSMAVMYPLDTIKTRIQMGQNNALRMDGIFNGVAGSLIGQIPYGVLTFGSYEIYKSILIKKASKVFNITDATSDQSTTPSALIAVYACAAILGDLTGSFWLCPSEVIKQQMQAGIYETMGGAVQTIWETKGFLGFYAGYLSAISRDVPFRMFQLTTFEVAKNFVLQWKKERNRGISPENLPQSTVGQVDKVELSSLEAALCGAAAGTLAAALTSPLDRIKTLLMTNTNAYGSFAECARQIVRDEGWQSLLLQGMVPRVTYIAPTVMIFFVVYEAMRQQLELWEDDEQTAGARPGEWGDQEAGERLERWEDGGERGDEAKKRAITSVQYSAEEQ